jgi:hypothetical protein
MRQEAIEEGAYHRKKNLIQAIRVSPAFSSATRSGETRQMQRQELERRAAATHPAAYGLPQTAVVDIPVTSSLRENVCELSAVTSEGGYND